MYIFEGVSVYTYIFLAVLHSSETVHVLENHHNAVNYNNNVGPLRPTGSFPHLTTRWNSK